MKVIISLLKPIIIIFSLVIILFNVGLIVYTQSSRYTSTSFWENFPTLKHAYVNSQYVSKHPLGWIPDESVNAYAAGAYIQGVSPILIAPDTPPLGRYLIGLSALLFNNENVIILISGIGSLVMMYLLGMQIFKRHDLALIAPAFVSFEPFFLNQFIYTPLLDIMQLFFLLITFYFFNLALVTKKKKIIFFLLTNFFLGCFIATKFYITGITVVAAFVVTLLILRRFKDIILYGFTVSLAVLVLLLSYVRVLFDHYPLLKFLGIQKYVFVYHKSQLMYPFSVWDLLLFNKWHVWFGNSPVISDGQWRISWPLVTISTFGTGILLLVKKVKLTLQILPLLVWVVLYLLFSSVGQISSRYFIIMLPIMYIVTVYFFVQLLQMLYTKKEKKK